MRSDSGSGRCLRGCRRPCRRHLPPRACKRGKCPQAASAGVPQPPKHLLDVGDGGIGQNAVAQIEDQSAAAEVRADVVDGVIECSAAGQQDPGIEVPLHGDPALNPIANESRLGRPVDAHRIDRNTFHIRCERLANATGESDELRVRDMTPYFSNDPFCRLDAPAIELARRQDAGPGIESCARSAPACSCPTR